MAIAEKVHININIVIKSFILRLLHVYALTYSDWVKLTAMLRYRQIKAITAYVVYVKITEYLLYKMVNRLEFNLRLD